MKESELALAVWEVRLAALGLVEDGGKLEDLIAERLQTLEQDRWIVGEVASLHSDRGLALDAGEAGGEREPFLEGADSLLGEPVVRSLARPARRLHRGEVAELLKPLRLGVDLARGPCPVEALSSPRHLHQVVRAGAIAADQVHHNIGEVS